MTLQKAAIAANRFGLGAKPGELNEIKSDPRGWLEAQLDRDVEFPEPIKALPPTGSDQIAFPLARRMVAQAAGLSRENARARIAAGDRPSMGADQAPRNAGGNQGGLAAIGTVRDARVSRAVKARYDAALTTDQPFRERLVHFWSNHFVVSAAKPTAFSMPASFERDVARTHVAHRFEDMLIASSKHPAMLFYLDNYTSIGPNSKWGQDPELVPFVAEAIGRPEGLNENLAREILELHTVGVNGGYTQTDVTNFAKVITGWGYNLRRGFGGDPRQLAKMSADDIFYFNADAHEPGPQTVMGKSYDGDGVDQGLAVLADLAVHPMTAKFVATKLVRHFIADTPPPAAVAAVEKAFLDSAGDLVETYKALIRTPEAWEPGRNKMKPPEAYLMSALRAMEGPSLEGPHIISILSQMGQQPFMQPGPDGWPDTADHWTGADALWKRLEWAMNAAEQQATAASDPARIAFDVLGPDVSPGTITEIQRAESPEQGLALLLVSSDFLRR